VLLVFITLGANLPLGTMAENLLPALAVIAVLLFVARPLTVLACLLPDRRGRWTRNENRLHRLDAGDGRRSRVGGGPAPGHGVPNEDEMVTVVALAIVVTLVLQTTTQGLARGATGPPRTHALGRLQQHLAKLVLPPWLQDGEHLVARP
jgi:cell volume regulation protein A